MKAPSAGSVSLVRRLRERAEDFAGRPSAPWTLFGVAFIEASLVPFPPDALLIPMGLARPERSYAYAMVCVAGSVAGAFLGYFIGYAFFEAIGRPILELTGGAELFDSVLGRYRENGIITLFLAGFTPIPFKLFTIAAGFNQTLSLGTLALGAIIGRLARFLLVGALLRRFGRPAVVFLERHAGRLSLALLAIILLGVLAVKLLA